MGREAEGEQPRHRRVLMEKEDPGCLCRTEVRHGHDDVSWRHDVHRDRVLRRGPGPGVPAEGSPAANRLFISNPVRGSTVICRVWGVASWWTAVKVAVLSPDAQALAPAVAVAGLSPSLRLAGDLSGLDANEAAEAADELAKVRLLEPGLPLRFVHPLVRRVVYQMLPPVRRASAHARAAMLLEAAGARPSEIAVHLLFVEPRSGVSLVETMLEAAAEAVARGDPDTAATFMRRALQEPPAGSEVLRRLVLLRRHCAIAAPSRTLRRQSRPAPIPPCGPVSPWNCRVLCAWPPSFPERWVHSSVHSRRSHPPPPLPNASKPS